MWKVCSIAALTCVWNPWDATALCCTCFALYFAMQLQLIITLDSCGAFEPEERTGTTSVSRNHSMFQDTTDEHPYHTTSELVKHFSSDLTRYFLRWKRVTGTFSTLLIFIHLHLFYTQKDDGCLKGISANPWLFRAFIKTRPLSLCLISFWNLVWKLSQRVSGSVEAGQTMKCQTANALHCTLPNIIDFTSILVLDLHVPYKTRVYMPLLSTNGHPHWPFNLK